LISDTETSSAQAIESIEKAKQLQTHFADAKLKHKIVLNAFSILLT
jgi:hypothetical protein